MFRMLGLGDMMKSLKKWALIVILLGILFGFTNVGHELGHLVYNILTGYHAAQQGAQGH